MKILNLINNIQMSIELKQDAFLEKLFFDTASKNYVESLFIKKKVSKELDGIFT